MQSTYILMYADHILIRSCSMSELTKHEEVILVCVLHLKDNAYGVHIRRRIAESTGKNWNYGTLYRLLDQLVKKGLLIRQEGEPLPEKGGRRKIFYKLSPEGIESLQQSMSFHASLWNQSTRDALENPGI